MSVAEIAVHGGRGRGRAGLASAAETERPVVRLVTFGALALYGVLRWATLENPAPGSRLAGMVLLAVLVAGAGPPLQRRSRTLAIAGLLISFLAMLAIAGIPVSWLLRARVSVIANGIGLGLSAIPGALVPYLGFDAWLRLVIVLGAGVLLLDAALMIAFAPRALGDLRRAGAALPLVALAIVPATLVRPQLPYLQGMILFVLVAAFMWGERVAPRRAGGATALACAAGVAGMIIAPAIELHHAWINPRGLAGSPTHVQVDTFDWTQRYGAFNWPRDNRDVLGVKAVRPDYWKAQNLDVFDGTSWAQGSGPTGSLVPSPSSWAVARYTQTLDVSVLSMNSTDVIAGGYAARPRHIDEQVVPGGSPGTWVTGAPLKPGDTYTVSTYSPDPTAAELRSDVGAYPQQALADELTIGLPWRGLESGAPYEVQFPVFHSGQAVVSVIGPAGATGQSLIENSPYARAYALARALSAGASSPFAFVEAVDRYLSPANGFVYDEHPRLTPFPIETFLFSSKRGYCQQFAGAMALLLRMGGVPARVVTGFTTGEYDGATHQYVATDLDAHAWVEAWFPAYGWVRFDPTPSNAPARASGGGGILPVLGRKASSRKLHRADRRALGNTGSPASLAHQGSGATVPIIASVLAFVLLLATGLFAAQRRRRVPSAQLLVAELERALARSGRPLEMDVTLYALERRFRASPEAQGYVRGLRLARFGAVAELPRRSQRRALRAQLAAGLGLVGKLRAWWALPPRVLH